MHDLIHDLAISVTGIECKFLQVNAAFSGKVRHILVMDYFYYYWEPLLREKKLRTFLQPNDLFRRIRLDTLFKF